jgi:hypothetical protein
MTLTIPVRTQGLWEDKMESEGAAREPVSQGAPAEGERRAAPRHNSTLKITCYPVNASLLERRQGRVRNVSRTGVGLLVDRAWQRGATVILELPAEDGFKAVRAKVVHATPQIGGTFLVGCALELPLTDAEVQALSR